MKNMITLTDGTKVWPRYPRRRHDWKEMAWQLKTPNRSKRARGKARLMYNSLYHEDRERLGLNDH